VFNPFLLTQVMTSQASKRGRIGRPPAGARDGEKVKDYPQLSIRLPADVKAKLQALSVIEARPQWRVITDAIDCYANGRSESERRLIAELAGRSRARANGGRRTAR
jgi:predicted DNA-binding protein